MLNFLDSSAQLGTVLLVRSRRKRVSSVWFLFSKSFAHSSVILHWSDKNSLHHYVPESVPGDKKDLSSPHTWVVLQSKPQACRQQGCDGKQSTLRKAARWPGPGLSSPCLSLPLLTPQGISPLSASLYYLQPGKIFQPGHPLPCAASPRFTTLVKKTEFSSVRVWIQETL